jgi:ATP-dependent RNA helicase DeaD
MDVSFETLGLQPQLLQAINTLGYVTPSPIQMAAIPLLLNGNDVIGQAQTGTGKTAAFGLPMLQTLRSDGKHVQALVITPTRELAIQVTEALTQMAANTPLRLVTVYGGQSYLIQKRALERGVDVVVGTPGRLLDLIRQKVLNLSSVHYMVVDEADEMLEMGFIDDVETIFSELSEDRQTALFSATMPNAVRQLAKKYLKDPQQITIDPEKKTVSEIEQRFYRVREDQKLAALTRILEMEDVKCALIFTRTKARAQELADEMNRTGFPAESLHGDLNQARREMVLNRFRTNLVTLLVATDVAARGLDIDDVSHVFNYDLPQDSEDYVHRIGRTGRAGRKGVSVTFFIPREFYQVKQIESYTHQPITETTLPTREDVIHKRDERFIARLYAEFLTGKYTHEREMVQQLLQADVDLMDIAAAAVKLARANEQPLSLSEIVQPTLEKRSYSTSTRGKTNRNDGDRSRSDGDRGRSDRHSKTRGDDTGSYAPQGTWMERPREEGMVRLRMNLGKMHGIRPGDVVGAIAGETGIPGKAIGAIEIRDRHTLVDVAEKHVKKVLKASSGQYQLRGKPILLTLENQS